MSVRDVVEELNFSPPEKVYDIVRENPSLSFKALPYVKAEKRKLVAEALKEILLKMTVMEFIEFIASMPPRCDVVKRSKILVACFH